MKKGFYLLVICFMFLLVGCGEIDDSWNGVYENESGYSVLIYTADDKMASIMVRQIGPNFTFYPINYENFLSVSETSLTALRGEKLTVEKTGDTITVKVDAIEKGVWSKIEGEYTKVKNAKRYSNREFK